MYGIHTNEVEGNGDSFPWFPGCCFLAAPSSAHHPVAPDRDGVYHSQRGVFPRPAPSCTLGSFSDCKIFKPSFAGLLKCL